VIHHTLYLMANFPFPKKTQSKQNKTNENKQTNKT
jgi:hypothetical protein